MYITPITCPNIYNNGCCKSLHINFTAHPDFYKINSTQSCYFRRGVVTIVNESGYTDIENLYTKIFSDIDNEPKKMLIIGIGHSQEPFSYLASIKGIIHNRPLNKSIDLYTVDLQSKPELTALKYDSFCDLFEYENFPKYAGKSFVKDTTANWLGKKEAETIDFINYYIYRQKSKTQKPRYRVNDEIFNFVWESYNNPEKSKWESRIQDVILEYPDNKFDIISANNVLPYISDDTQLINTLKHIRRILKPGGYFITDPYDYSNKFSNVLKDYEKISPGIYRKK